MRALIVSDLHFEWHRDAGKTLVDLLPDADVCICAGDLSNAAGLWEGLLRLLARFPHVVYVFGNHEFYGSNIPAVRKNIARLQDRLPKLGNGYGQLHVLDNSVCEIEGRRFVGTTMWTRRSSETDRLAGHMSDFEVIGNPMRIYEENEIALKFLDETVRADDIVITHHLPAQMSVHPRYAGNALNVFFLCDVEPLIQDRQPKLWVHGHTHSSCDYVIGTTQVVCNPFGYVGYEENPEFNSELIVEL